MEEWKPVKDFEGRYEVSNRGRVRSLRYKGNNGKIGYLTPCDNGAGYLFVYLCDELLKKHRYAYIHRMVAEAFISNPNGFSEINHINECKHDNRVENLEWCNHRYNINYGSRNERVAKKCGKKVAQYDMEMNKIAEFETMREAFKKTGISNQTISLCCSGKIKTSGGYHWSYLE